MAKLGKYLFVLFIFLGLASIYALNLGFKRHKYDLLRIQGRMPQEETSTKPTPLPTPKEPTVNIGMIITDKGIYPNNLTIRQGERVRITITNSEGYHNFAVPELGLHSPLLATLKKSYFEFLATRSGIFEFSSDTNVSDGEFTGGILTVK